MKRRNFVQKTAVGVLGYHVLPTFLDPGRLFRNHNSLTWVDQLCKATGTTHRTDGSLSSIGFYEAIESVNAAFASRGFTYTKSGYHFYNHPENYCFYVLEFHHVQSGISDLLIPVLHELPDGIWRHFKTLDCFQLEALVRSAVALGDFTEPLQQLLLPVFGNDGHKTQNLLRSTLATIDIVTHLDKDYGAKTRVDVSMSEQSIFSDTFISEHCLTIKPSLA